MVPCVIFEDEHLLAVHKPAGWNTHTPAPFAGEGIYDWLKHREPRWASLAIIHRLDKETSGTLLFGKTSLANKSLTEQFTHRRVRKKYLLLTDRPVPARAFTVRTALARVGEKYASRPGGEPAETHFRLSNLQLESQSVKLVEAEPRTGRTHQIRVHAAESGFPILGDTLYGGTTAARVFLHAAEIEFVHPAKNKPVTLIAPADFGREPRLALRRAFIEPEATDAFRLIHGASDGWPGWYVDKLGGFLLSQSEMPLAGRQNAELASWAGQHSSRGVYHKILSRRVRCSTTAEASPRLILGKAAPERFEVLENGVRYEMSFNEGYSVGLFLDQRDNRRRLLNGHIASDFELPMADCPSPHVPPDRGVRTGNGEWEILNCFAYTCGFSVCAAKAGARTTSLDLSPKYLEWGRRNFALNGIDSTQHDFIFGDTFDWLRRFTKKGRAFDAIVLDPPTFSQSKEQGVFRAEKDYGKLVTAALPVLKPGGGLLASTNAAGWHAEDFLAVVESAVRGARRKIRKRHFAPQPLDFPASRGEPAYLKAVWLMVD